jgi:uncharacterized protein YoxC
MIPTVIDTAHLHQTPKCRQNDRVQPSYIDIYRGHGNTDNDSSTVTQQPRPIPVLSPGSQVIPTQQAGLTSPPSEGAMSSLANMKRKVAEIDKEREKLINSQQKIKDDVSEMNDSFIKMSGDMVNLSQSVGQKMKELKEIISSLINSRLIPKRVHQDVKRANQVVLNMGHHQMRLVHIHQYMRRNHGTACVNLMESHIASSTQIANILPMTMVQWRSCWGLTCTNGGTMKYGWGISGPQPLTSNAGQLAKFPDSPPFLP